MQGQKRSDITTSININVALSVNETKQIQLMMSRNYEQTCVIN